MYLFLIVSPLALYALVVGDSGGLKRVGEGAAAGLPSLLVPALLQAVLPSTYRPFLHYLVLAAVHHVGLFAALTAWWLGLRGYRSLEDEAGRRRWGDFLSFACGFYATAAIVYGLAHWGEADAHAALLLPVLRLVLILAASVLMILYFESYGLFRLAYAAAYLMLPFATALATYLDYTHRTASAILVTGVLAASAAGAWVQRERF